MSINRQASHGRCPAKYRNNRKVQDNVRHWWQGPDPQDVGVSLPMKILQVIHTFPPHSLAGSEIYTYNLSRELAKSHEVVVFHAINDPDAEEYDIQVDSYHGFKVSTINNTFKHCTSFETHYRNEMIAKKFGELLDEVTPDIVHIGHLIDLSVTLVDEAKKRNIPVVLTLHDFWLFCPLGRLLKADLTLCQGPQMSECAKCLAPQLSTTKGLRRLYQAIQKVIPNFDERIGIRKILSVLYRQYAKVKAAHNDKNSAHIENRALEIKRICSLVDVFIAPSRFLLEKFVEFGIPKQKLIYCDPGFDTLPFNGVPKKYSRKIRFGYIGTLIPSKGLHVLMEAFNAIHDEDVELRIHGYYSSFHLGFEDYPNSLRAMSSKQNVYWGGKYDNTDVATILSEVDVLVVPSIWYENSPLTIHEAFLAGVPVITSNIGGMAELVEDGVNGLHFQMGNAADLARQLQRVIDDPALIAQLQKNVPPVTPIESHALKIETIYRGLLPQAPLPRAMVSQE